MKEYTIQITEQGTELHHALGISDERRVELLMPEGIDTACKTGVEAFRLIQKLLPLCKSMEEVVILAYTVGGFMEMITPGEVRPNPIIKSYP